VPNDPDVSSCGAASSTIEPAVPRAERQDADEALERGRAELHPSIIGVVRAWRQLVALLPNDAVLRACLDLLHRATMREPSISDHELCACLVTEVGAQRALASPSGSNELNP
jgi:hypothetical protein